MLNLQAYAKIYLHAAKYPTQPIVGVLVGHQDQITDAIPLFHSLLLPGPLLQAALEQIQENIIGLYYSNQSIQMIELLGLEIKKQNGNCLLIKFDRELVVYKHTEQGWKEQQEKIFMKEFEKQEIIDFETSLTTNGDWLNKHIKV
ncbi:ER membrane protein complex subunit 8 [Boothiomyces sp. JEL0866]|nr:ER membrane protein complex subunit 8 [Boothiomyces sp. JEL0866]